ncbi:PKD domain-containing protein [Nakamurella deserti]|uniref:PKD domain-containing protein n=1 Tax=Nakamurella deserti TaxID=2164074 RepID=UPI000DBE147A|nr:PKD domain-containing protein [Nakamurella deserti]
MVFHVRTIASRGRGVALALAACLVVGGLGVGTVASAAADPAPVQPRTAGVVTADVLPTAQINGVAWAQVVIGNTVYVGGEFSSARPAGSPAGQNESARGNLLAYNLTTGALISSFAPKANAQVKALAAAPDGRTLYVGGNFTSVDGVAKSRIAAFDTATGALKTSFTAGVSYTVSSMAATADTLYVGGAFDASGKTSRIRLAAFAAGTGALTGWAPTADGTVHSMALSPDGSKLIVGGMFTTLNGVAAKGIGAVDARAGTTVQPWKTNDVFFSGGPNASVLTLSSDGTSVYGGVYKYNSTGALEGTFKIDPNDGTVQWLSDCHGDVYGVWAGPAAVYQVGHSHYCGNHLGWPQPKTWDFNRGVAYTKAATGTLTRDAIGGSYGSYPGVAAPSLYSWFPRLDAGTYTGKTQAAWTVAGNADYVVVGGEFPTVNGTAQQGLARFAVRTLAPDDQGPRLSGSSYLPVLSSTSAGTVRVSATANWDRDDRTLTHRIQRSGVPAGTWTTVATRTADSAEWERPPLGHVDTGLTAGAAYSYRILVADADGNSVTGGTATVTVASSGTPTAYGRTVLEQGASLYWPLDDTSGPAVDLAGHSPGVPNTGVTRGAAGAIAGSAAMTFNGTTTGDLAASGTLPSTDTFTASAWFRTTSTAGGRILGFSDLPTGTSAHRDRQLWLGTNGQLNFGVFAAARTTLTSARSYNDGAWHQAVASLGPNGMVLTVDGVRVGQRSDVTAAEKYIGTWRIGGDSLAGWGTGGWFNGSIDEVSIYPTVLTAQQINAQYVASGRSSTLPAAPTDPYGAAVFADQPTAYWRLTELTGMVAADAGPFRYPATYQIGTTRGQAGALAGSTNPATLFNGTSGSMSSDASFTAPGAYSVETWFRTTSTTGGSLIGFGNSRVGPSTTNDRQVYLRNDGKVAFRTGTGAGAAVVVSPTAYNNGAWHHVVASQGAGGMVLYVDGAPVGTNPSTTAAAYSGYWRVGADPTGDSTSAFVNATIDEPAVYGAVLGPERVAAHYQAARGTAPNRAPTAVVTTSTAGLTVNASGTGSSDPDGTVTGYAWNFGDTTTGTGATTSHTYTAAGTYTVTLTVTDNAGATATSTASVTVTAPPAPNQAPTAVVTTSTAGLTVNASGTGSSDPDGTVTGYAWNFGDTTTGTGATTSHTYTAAGTYTVTLTVTDNAGATATATASVTVTAPPATPVFADDTFGRTVTSGWGSAAVGGAWTVSGATPTATVGGGLGRLPINAGQTRTAILGGVAESDVDLRTTVTLDKAPVGGSTLVSTVARRSSSGEYRMTAAFSTNAGRVNLQLNRIVGSTTTQIAVLTVPNLTYTAGSELALRLRVVSTGGTTQLQGKAWPAGSPEPEAWTVTATDTAAVLPAGTVGLLGYVSGAATNAPVTLGVRSFNGQRVAP